MQPEMSALWYNNRKESLLFFFDSFLVSQGDFFFVLALKVQVFSQVVLRKMTACAGLPLMPGRHLLSQRGKSK